MRRVRRRVIRGAIAQIASLRYEFDAARDPDSYPNRTVAAVTLEGDDVLVLWDLAGEVLNRYRLLRAPALWMNSPRQAYVCFAEL